MTNLLQNLKNKIILASFILYLFFWSYTILEINYLRYFILIPFFIIFLNLSNLKTTNLNFFFFIPLLLLTHYFISNLINDSSIKLYDLSSIVFLSIIIFSFVNYRNLILSNFNNILKVYFVTLIIFSIIINQNINVGSCGNIILQEFPLLLKISISNGFFSENSHLAMMNIAAILSALYSCFEKKDNTLFILAILALIINIFNLSTTFVLGFILCVIILIFKTKKLILNLIISSISLLLFIFYLISDNCNKKLENIKLNDVINEKVKRKTTGDLTSTIYERSMIITIDTLKNNPLGWGYNGSIKATKNYFNKNKSKFYYNIVDRSLNRPDLKTKPKALDNYVWKLNLQDALGNIFKLVIEFGYIIFLLPFLFLKYLLKKNFSNFDFFVVSIFLVQLFRGAGYINGGFIIAVTEIFLIQYLIKDNHHLNKKFQN